MNLVLKFFFSFSVFFLLGFVSQAQTATAVNQNLKTEKCNPANCKPENCTPEMCKKLVEAGICTPEQVAACQSGMADSNSEGTRVASQKLIAEEVPVTSKNVATVVKNSETPPSETPKKNCCAASCSKKTK